MSCVLCAVCVYVCVLCVFVLCVCCVCVCTVTLLYVCCVLCAVCKAAVCGLSVSHSTHCVEAGVDVTEGVAGTEDHDIRVDVEQPLVGIPVSARSQHGRSTFTARS